MLLVLVEQIFLHAFHISPAYPGHQAFLSSVRVARLLSTDLTTSELAGRALPGSQLVSIAMQLYLTWESFCTVLGLAYCVPA